MTLTLEIKEKDKTQAEHSPSNLFSSQSASQLPSNTHEKLGLIGSIEGEIDDRNLSFYYPLANYKILIEKDIEAENLSQPKVFNLPHAPKWCSGIVNIRGTIVPVVNMHYFLKTKIKYSLKNSKLLLLRSDSIEPIIIQIDSLPTMINLDNYSKQKNQTELPEWAEVALENDKTKVLKVDHSYLLNQLKTRS